MSNKTTLQSHNTRLQNLINTANSLPNAGSGGVETVPLNLWVFDVSLGNIAYSKYDNGAVSVVNETFSDFEYSSQKQVILGSLILLQCEEIQYYDEEYSYGVTTLYKNGDGTIAVLSVDSEDNYVSVELA